MASNEAVTTTEVVIIDDESKEGKENEMTTNEENDSLNKSANNQTASCPNSPKTPLNETKLKDKSKSEKIDKNLKIQMKLENAKKRQEEKEKKDKEKQRKDEERKQKELERLKQKEEELKKKEEERIKREAEKRQREEERLKKEEERKQKELERLKKKEEEEKKKEEERLKREEERLKKEEERKQKEEERLKREEEKQKEEEEKRKKADMAKNQFKSYFIKKDLPNLGEITKEDYKHYRFMPFQPKENMTIAPISFRKDFSQMSQDERAEFFKTIDDAIFQEKEISLKIYLKEAQQRASLKKCNQSSNNSEPPSQEVKVISFDSNRTKFKVKYLHFDPKVYRRPAYYGTWRKKSTTVKARKPFGKDQNLDYEIDSDDEWEDEPEGESISGSECDDDEEMVEDDDDDGFFVPHGHLSDDELDEEDRSLDPETKKARENAKTEQWEKERKKMCKVLTAKHFMVENYWNSNSKIKNKINEIEYLKTLKAIALLTEFPIVIINENLNEKQVSKEESTPKAKSKSSNNHNNHNANKEAVEQASPSMSIKAKSKQKSNNTNPGALSPTTNTPSIIKFISKMGNKNVICKVDSTNESSSVIAEAKSPSVMNIKSANAHPSPKQQTPNTNVSVAEKRVCSGNSESAVKRLKLENEQDIKDSSPKIMTLTVTPQLKNNKKTLKFVTSTNDNKEKIVEKMNSSHSNNQEPEKMEIDGCSIPKVGTEKTSTSNNNELIAPNNKENQIDCIIIEDVK